MNNSKPRCNHTPGCCACKAGYCLILKGTNFGDRPCPFYKTKAQNEEEKRQVMERLREEQRIDLIEKYYHGGDGDDLS